MFRYAALVVVLHFGDFSIYSWVQPAEHRLASNSVSWSTSSITQGTDVRPDRLEGYAFREADGGPPFRPLTVELIDQGKAKYRQTTRADGAFAFVNVREMGSLAL